MRRQAIGAQAAAASAKVRRAGMPKRQTRPGAGRWLAWVVSVFALAWFATQLFYFAQIALWNFVDPQSTAFMRTDAARLSAGRPDLSIQHQWVPYDQIS